MPKPSEVQSFESAIGRLEHLVGEMESDEMPLEQLLLSYEEGIKLVKVCQEKLADAEKKIEIIQRNAAGEPELKPFDPATKAEPAAGPRSASAKDASLF